MNILIINTGRFGDVIQTYPLIKGLKKKYPDSRLYYLVLENFKEPVSLFKEVDSIITINFAHVLRKIDNNNLEEAYERLKNFFSKFNSFYFDLLINVSFSRLSACISSIFNSKNKRGLILSENNEFIAPDKWSKFFLSIVDYREFCPFNLVDIFARIGGVNSEHININFNGKLKNIGFQMGASTFNRKWSVKNFSNLAKLLVENDPEIKIYLLGSRNEISLGEEFFFHFSHKNVKNFIGKTTIAQLYRILKEDIDLLITNDTGTMHLCWFAGKRVIELSLGPAYYITTGPYGEGHTIIQPDIECSPCSYTTECLNLKCHESIFPELVFSVINNGEFNQFKNIKIVKTYYDSDNYLSYNQIFPIENKQNNYLKHLWLDVLLYRVDFENFFYNFPKKHEVQQIIAQIIGEIDKILLKTDRDFSNSVEKIETNEKILKDYIYCNYQNFIPFFKYFEYLKMDLPENDFFKLMEILRNNYLKLYYLFCKKIEKNKEF